MKLSKATKKATGKATWTVAHQAAGGDTSTITFGTLTFPLNPELPSSPLQVTSTEIQNGKQPQTLRTNISVPAQEKAHSPLQPSSGNREGKTPGNTRMEFLSYASVVSQPTGTNPQRPYTNTLKPVQALPAKAREDAQHRSYAKNKKASTPPNKFNVPRKFHKVPPATEKWQKVLPKNKLNATSQKRCFFCHKIGHLQRFCLKKIKCCSCGRYGHKWAKCLFKLTENTQNQTNRTHKAAPPKETNLQTPLRPMEFIHGRPPIGDIYCPPRVALNDDNEHLTAAGLIVLIRGSPAADLPRLIASTIAAEHGGRPGDYAVYQASITPYIISCPNTQIRDAVVQRGIYSIPRNQCQFTVNQWRPRFGMGFNPPSYQVWVKIMGLPLQAWTVPEVTAIVQRFGHPLHIQPFGAAAGHFRDISVLIATVHPARIPLAYMYREGDYSAQIDILILSWLQWEDNYFPPPDAAQAHGDSLAPPQHHVEHTVSANNSSSSSSNSAPSEPTIDYSCWSPRSFKLQGMNNVKWKLKVTSGWGKLANTRSENTSCPVSCHKGFPTFTGLSPTFPTPRPQTLFPLATEDPKHLRDPQWESLISAILKSFPPPVELILPLSLTFWKTGHSTSRAAQSHRSAPLSHTSPRPHPKPTLSLALASAFKTPLQMMEQAVLCFLKLALKGLDSPLWPNPTPLPCSAHNTTQAHLAIELPLPRNKPNSTCMIREINSSPQVMSKLPALLDDNGHEHNQNCGHGDPLQQNDSPHLQLADPAFFSVSTEDRIQISTHLTQMVSDPIPANPNQTSSSSPQNSAKRHKKKRGKEKMTPTRRSPRLQAKIRTNNNILNEAQIQETRPRGSLSPWVLLTLLST